MSLQINDDKVFEKYKNICTKNKDWVQIKLDTLWVHDDTYIKTKIKTYGDKLGV